MRQVFADYAVSISELKKSPSSLLFKAGDSPIATLHHNKPVAYLVPVTTYEALVNAIEDYELGGLVEERRGECAKAFTVSLDDL